MRSILQKKSLRFVFAANVISMLGSGMNSTAVAWYVLQATHSKMALGTLAVVQTIPAILLLPFTGVVIDREDRRRLVMLLDALRAIVILGVAVLAFANKAKVWQLYAMNALVAAGFLGVLADHHRADSGTHARRRVCSCQYILTCWSPGWMAASRRNRWFRIQ